MQKSLNKIALVYGQRILLLNNKMTQDHNVWHRSKAKSVECFLFLSVFIFILVAWSVYYDCSAHFLNIEHVTERIYRE